MPGCEKHSNSYIRKKDSECSQCVKNTRTRKFNEEIRLGIRNKLPHDCKIHVKSNGNRKGECITCLQSKKFNSRRHELKNNFKITLEDYDKMHQGQNGVCAVCDKTNKAEKSGIVRNLAVDHCHLTGKIRGLLCRDCNLALGFAKDSKDILLKMIGYLNK